MQTMPTKWCRIELAGQPVYALVEGDEVKPIDAAPFDNWRRTGAALKLSDAKLLAPVVPGNFHAAGLNFRSHIDWANLEFGKNMPVPAQADIGSRSANALVGNDAEVIVPADAKGPFQYEGELVAVIGRQAKSLSEADALSCVAGYTLGNDFSERGWQFSDRTLWRAKSSDTFKPMGPCVVSGIEPMNQQIDVKINGKTVSSYNTSAMIFSVATYISRMSQYITLYPGDVIWFGCDGPTLPNVRHGDIVEVINSEIGILRNRVVWLPTV